MSWRTCLALLLGTLLTAAGGKPTVFNHVTGDSAETNALLKAALEPDFTIIDIVDEADFAPARPTALALPRVAKSAEGKALGGDVLIGYVVSQNGRAISPRILRSADARLDTLAMQAMADWRFEPATLKGSAVASTAAQAFTFETTPTEFVTRVLEPLGGKVPCPKDWFYAESHGGQRYTWTLSREDPTQGQPYTTGVRIQVFPKVKVSSGKAAKAFILDFMKSKQDAKGTKVISACEAERQGMFTRVCLETEEGPEHIVYSGYWGNDDVDLAVVTTSETATELWETYAPAFDTMKGWELADMSPYLK